MLHGGTNAFKELMKNVQVFAITPTRLSETWDKLSVTCPPCTSLITLCTELAKFWHILADTLRITWGHKSEIIHLCEGVKFRLRTVVSF